MTYSSSLAVGRQRYSQRSQNTVSYKSSAKAIGPVSNSIILIVLACLLGLLYLSQVTKTNTYGYQVNNLQQQQTELKAENDNLQVASARLQSIDKTKNSAVAKDLVAVAPSGTTER